MKIPLRLLPLGALLVCSMPLRAALLDEIQVYDDTINRPKQFGLELHANSTTKGRSVPDYPGEITPQRGVRVTPEFSYGLNRDFELGLYLPTVWRADDGYVVPGWKVRLKWIPLHAEEHGGWFAGTNGELSNLSRQVDPTRWSFESRNIAGWRNQDWLVASNLVFDWALSDQARGWRPDSEFDVKVARKIARGVSVGPEYYAGFGKLGRPDPFALQNHTVFAAVDVDLKPFVFNFGVGRGMSHNADRWTLKAIFELPW